MRNISFQKTLAQFIDGTKTVTRRMGWKHLKDGDILMGVEKAMGLRKGEKLNKLGVIQVVSIRWEPIEDITQEDVCREGFPHWTKEQFIEFFCDFNKCKRTDQVNRIEFKKLSQMKDLHCYYKDYLFSIDKEEDGRYSIYVFNSEVSFGTAYDGFWDPEEYVFDSEGCTQESEFTSREEATLEDAFIEALKGSQIEEVVL